MEQHAPSGITANGRRREAGAILLALLTTMLVSTLVMVRHAAEAVNLSHQTRLSLIMRNVSALAGCLSTSRDAGDDTGAGRGTGEMPPCDVVVRVEDANGQPIPGARIVGLYTDSEGQTTSMSQVTNENGEAVFPGSNHPIIFEVQFPVGVLPCPGSPPRVEVNPGQTAVKFVGCRL